MSSMTHTLNDLVDLALQTPEKGAVNFNILRVVLLKIIEKLDFGKETVEYKPPDIRTSILKLPEIKTHDRSFKKDVRETKVRLISEKEPERKEKGKEPAPKMKDLVKETPDRVKIEAVDSSLELDDQVQASEEDMQPDSTTQDEPEVEVLEDPLQEDVVSSTTSDTFSPESEDSEYESETSEEEVYKGQEDERDIVDEKEKDKPRPKRKKEDPVKRGYSTEKRKDPEKRKSSSKKKEAKSSTDEEQKPKQSSSSVWHMLQIKKLAVKIDGVEDKINSVSKSVEELMKFKEERERRTKFEEGQKLQSEYSSPYISREEFENTIDDMGEALSRLFTNQRHQKEECNTINQNILKELSLKASVDDLNRHSEPINSKFRTLGTALSNIQKLIKDVIYPESCGITKCMACGRKSQLPLRRIVVDGKKYNSKYKDDIESIIRISKEEKSEDLKFTNASLRRIEKHQMETDEGVVPQDADQQDIHLERPLFPDYLVELETLCDTDKLSKEFTPLRRFPDLKRSNTLYIPSVRPRKNPVSISIIGNDNAKILIKN